MLGTMLENLRERAPLIHNITNYVTVNDCANILLACGASPIMADEPGEVREITALCRGLCINIGTLNARTIPAMLVAGRRANALGIPAVLDPVGAGASALRTRTAEKLLRRVRFAAVRGNISEIRALALGCAETRGVDAAETDGAGTLADKVELVKNYARILGAVVAVTGAVDIVSDGATAYCIRNGDPRMSRITGTGCQLSAMTAAYLAANPGTPLEAVAAAVCAMGLCGETAAARLTAQDGNATYRNYIIDAVYNLTPRQLEEGARYEIR